MWWESIFHRKDDLHLQSSSSSSFRCWMDRGGGCCCRLFGYYWKVCAQFRAPEGSDGIGSHPFP